MNKRIRLFLVCALLSVVVFTAYWQVLGHDFVVYFDDGEYVTENMHVIGGPTWDSIKWAFTSFHSANWHPLTWISHMVDCRLYGMNATGHHLTNLLFHAANTILLFLVLTAMTGYFWRSAFVAALFAVHPAHVESVAWIAERKDVLSTFFWLLTMAAYFAYTRRPGLGRYFVVVLALAHGLISKPMLVTLPFVLLVLDYWPLKRFDQRSFRLLVVEKVPLFILSAMSAAITCIAQARGGAVGSFDEYSLGVRIANALTAYVGYVLKMLWPANLTAFYPHPGGDLPVWQVAASAIALAGLCLLVIRYGRRNPYLTVGFLWYVGTLIPVIGLMQVGGQAMADRYTYIPLIGLFIIAAWGIPEFLKGRGRVLIPAAACVITGVLATLTYAQTAVWKDSETLFKHALRINPDNYAAHDALGLALIAQERFEEAETHFREALSLAPWYIMGRNNLGVAVASQGRLEEAISEYRTVLEADPSMDRAHYNLGMTLTMAERLDEAIFHYQEAIRLAPNNPEAYNNLGNIYASQGRLEEAVKEYEKALEINRAMTEARTSLASALQRMGKAEEAARESQQAMESDPQSAAAQYNLGVSLQEQDRLDEAIAAYRQAIRIQPGFAQAHNNLALAYFEKGDYRQAWREVLLCREYGLEPHPQFIQALTQKMPDPGG